MSIHCPPPSFSSGRRVIMKIRPDNKAEKKNKKKPGREFSMLEGILKPKAGLEPATLRLSM